MPAWSRPACLCTSTRLLTRGQACWVPVRYAIERLLGKVDAVIYLLDATKLKTREELDLICKLRSLDPPLFSRLASRLFFVVTKMDSVRLQAFFCQPSCKPCRQMHVRGRMLSSGALMHCRGTSCLPCRADVVCTPWQPTLSAGCAPPDSAVAQLDADTDLQPDEMRQYAADLLNQQMAHPGFQLQPDQVCLLAA